MGRGHPPAVWLRSRSSAWAARRLQGRQSKPHSCRACREAGECGRPAEWPGASARHLGDQRVGEFDVDIDVLHVVVVLERADRASRSSRPPRRRPRPCSAAARPAPALRGSPNFASSAFAPRAALDRGDDLVRLLARLHVLGAGLDRRLQHRVVARRPCGRIRSSPTWSNMNDTAPVSASAPPALVK